ncbi:MAG: clostripain-related cysteine peptidase [Clostridia bacterium]|nr:clostripain-related cysteine peptidase [Clostridia bacterium]
MKRTLFILCALLALSTFTLAVPGSSEAGGAKLTLMIYMCGSNLESAYGSATADIQEMLASGCDFSRVNVLIMAGGTSRWDLGLDPDTLNVYRLTERGIRPVLRDAAASMGDTGTLKRLLDLGADQFPAKDYALILWNHGGGPLGGVCWDELFSMDNLTLAELTDALAASRLPGKLSWIGFDACLMGSVEVAEALSPFAKVMIASQETEPAPGWNYAFLKGIEADPDGAATGRRVIDAFFDALEGTGEALTLSCIDLDKVFHVTYALGRFFDRVGSKLNDESFSDYSLRRMETTSFGRAVDSSGYDLVDLGDLVRNYGGDAELSESLENAVFYCRSSEGNACGLSVYYPYGNIDMFESQWKDDYRGLGFSRSYTNYLNRFGTLLTGGEQADWSNLAAASEGCDAEGVQRFSLQLTGEQRASLASAQLYILQPNFGYDGNAPVALAPISVADAEISPDGLLTAGYDWRSVYVVDEDGAPLLGPVSFRRERGEYYSILTHYDGYTGLYPGRGSVSVLYDCAADPGSDAVTIAHTYVYDAASQSYTNRIPFSEEGYGAVHFHDRIAVPPPFEGVLPGFNDWDGFLGYHTDGFYLPRAWSLRFMDERLRSGPLYACFQLTDVHQRTFSSIPLRFDPPNQVTIPVSPEVLEIDDHAARLSAMLDLALKEPVLRLELNVENHTDGTVDYYQSWDDPPLLLNGEREPLSSFSFGKSYDIAPGGSILATVELDGTDLIGMQALETIDIAITWNPSGESTNRTPISLRFALGDCDVSTFAKALQPIAQTERNGVNWQLLSLAHDAESLDALLYIENDNEEALDCHVKAVVDGVFFERHSNSASVAPHHSGFARLNLQNGVELPAWDLEVENTEYYTVAPMYAHMNDMLARCGVTEITQVDLLLDFSVYNPDDRVTLLLDEPIPVQPAAENVLAQLPLVNGGFSAALESAFVADNGLALGLCLRNDTDAPLMVDEYKYAFNGSDAFSSPEYRRLGSHIPPHTVCYNWLPITTDGGFEKQSLSALSLSLLVSDQPQAPFTLRFPGGTAFGAPGGTFVAADDLEIAPVDYQVRLSALSGNVEMPDGPVNPLILPVPMTAQDFEDADFAEAILCVKENDGDTTGVFHAYTPFRILTSTPVTLDVKNRPVARFLGVSLLADGEPLRIFETSNGDETRLNVSDHLYFFRSAGEYQPDRQSYLFNNGNAFVTVSGHALGVRREGRELVLTGNAADLLGVFPTGDPDHFRESFTVDELPLYATEHRVYYCSSFLPDSINPNHNAQRLRALREPLELSLVPLDSLGKKLYLLVDFGTDESEHILFLDPATGETLFSVP